MAAKRSSAAAVLLWSHVVGLVLIVAAVSLVGGELTAHDLVIGALGGLGGAAGVGLLYQGLAIGPMSVVAPITALLATAVPLVAGFARDPRCASLARAGWSMASGQGHGEANGVNLSPHLHTGDLPPSIQLAAQSDQIGRPLPQV